MFEFPFERQSVPKLEQETATIRVDIVEKNSFAAYLVACKDSKKVANVNGRSALVTDYRLKGETHLEVDLRYCDFQSIKRVSC